MFHTPANYTGIAYGLGSRHMLILISLDAYASGKSCTVCKGAGGSRRCWASKHCSAAGLKDGYSIASRGNSSSGDRQHANAARRISASSTVCRCSDASEAAARLLQQCHGIQLIASDQRIRSTGTSLRHLKSNVLATGVNGVEGYGGRSDHLWVFEQGLQPGVVFIRAARLTGSADRSHYLTVTKLPTSTSPGALGLQPALCTTNAAHSTRGSGVEQQQAFMLHRNGGSAAGNVQAHLSLSWPPLPPCCYQLEAAEGACSGIQCSEAMVELVALNCREEGLACSSSSAYRAVLSRLTNLQKFGVKSPDSRIQWALRMPQGLAYSVAWRTASRPSTHSTGQHGADGVDLLSVVQRACGCRRLSCRGGVQPASYDLPIPPNSTATCYNDCFGRGICDKGMCLCSKGWSGWDCGESTSEGFIYVYNMPPEMGRASMVRKERRADKIYFAEQIFMEKLMSDWSVRTLDPTKATLFYGRWLDLKPRGRGRRLRWVCFPSRPLFDSNLRTACARSQCRPSPITSSTTSSSATRCTPS